MKQTLVVLSMLVASIGVASGQTSTGKIFGQVTDTTGALIPGVKVTLTSSAILQPMVVTTSAAGTYQFSEIPIGTYSVQFDASSYRSSLHNDVRVDIGFNAEVNVKLEVASLTTTIDVSSSAPVIDTQSTTQSAEMDLARLTELPSARSEWNIAELAPGVAGGTKDVGGASNGPQAAYQVRGADSNQTRFYMDGVDLGPAGSSTAFWVNFNEIQETQVTTGGAEPSQESSGMTINMVSKSGSDKFHGSGYYYAEGQTFESNNLDPALRLAVSLPSASAGSPLQHFIDEGGEVGGPIKKGKLWFWGAWDEEVITDGDDKVYKTSADCAPVAANQLAYSWNTVRSCTNSDPADLKHVDYKLSWSPFHHNTFTFQNGYSTKDQQHFMFSTTHPVETTVNLYSPYNSSSIGPRFWDSGWSPIWRFDDQHIISDRWLVDVAWLHFVKDNTMAAQSPAIAATAVKLENSTGVFAASSPQISQAYQPMNTFKVTSNYNLPGKLGGNHTIKVGYDYARYENIESQQAGGGAEEIYNSGTATPYSVPLAVNFYRSGIFQAYMYQQSFWVQDIYTHKRLTLNLGLRFDHQFDKESQASIAASQYEGQATATDAFGNPCNGGSTCVPFTFLPAFTYAGHDGVVPWNNFAPRLGATFDIFGTGKTVVKGAFGHYYDMRFSGELADAYDTITTATSNQGATLSYVQYPWNGATANGLPLLSGVSVIKPCATYPAIPCNTAGASAIRQFGAPYNPAAPSTAVSLNSVDPKIKNPNSYEVVGGVSQELGPGIALNVNYIYRRYVNIIWNQLNGISSSNYIPCQTSPTAATPCTITSPTGTQTTFSVAATPCPTTVAPTLPTQCNPVTVYMPNITLPAGYTITNIPDYHRAYNGLELTIRKVMTRNWMVDGGFTIQSSRQYWTAADAYQDPTNIAQQNGAQYTLGGAGVTNAKWIGRLAGRYRLPWYGITLSASDDFRQGYCVDPTIQVSSRANSAPSISVLLAPPCTQRFHRLQDMDMRVDKTFKFHDRINVEPSFDLYNLFNADTVLAQNVIENGSTANRISTVLGPRVARLGAVIKF